MCDEALVELANDATKGIEATLAAGLRLARGSDGWTALAELRATATAGGARRRRRPTTSTG